MPSCSKAKNPRGIEIVFTEADHKYKSTIEGNEITYVSGTQFLGKFYPPFDPTGEITARSARKAGVSVEEIKRQWEEKGKESCRLGTRLHETIEDTLLKNKYRNLPEDTKEQKRFQNGIDMGLKLLAKTTILGVEKIVFSDRLRIAGTIDLFAMSKKTGEFLIIDHKTNKSIDQENKYNKFCLSPVEHLPDLNFYHYALQLNLYEFLLKFENYVPREARFRLFLNHVTDQEAKLIELPDLQNEIKDLVIQHLIEKSDTQKANIAVAHNPETVMTIIDSL